MASAAQLASAQSATASQSLSRPSRHVVPASSLAGGAPQSTAQVQLVSEPVQAPSPQHEATPGTLVHLKPDDVHVVFEHESGF